MMKPSAVHTLGQARVSTSQKVLSCRNTETDIGSM